MKFSQEDVILAPQIRFPRSDIARLTNLFIIIIILIKNLYLSKQRCTKAVEGIAQQGLETWKL